MIKWIEILTILAVGMAILAITAGALVMWALISRAVKKVSIPKLPEWKQENIKMRDKDVAKEGVTFNDLFMFMIAVPLVLLWVGFA